MTKYIYEFGLYKTDGDASQKNLLGRKGANLAEMAKLKLPVPPGFTLSTECCNHYFDLNGCFPDNLEEEIIQAMTNIESHTGMIFGDPENPLLVSCRSGARDSMPGMMESILNVGLCTNTIPGLIKRTNNEWFVYDAYRRLIMIYSDVVMEKAEQIYPKDGMGIRLKLEMMMNNLKSDKGYDNDTDISTEDLKTFCEWSKKKIKEDLNADFPDDPKDQLIGSISAVFKSWNSMRAVSYRRIEHIPDDWGTAVTVQSMAFGNMGNTSATGVAFTRNPATGANKFCGEWLINAQGEDIVSGTRTPNPLNNDTKNQFNQHLPSLEEVMPGIYKQLSDIRTCLETHFKDMQDIEFTIEEGRLWILQTRIGKRTGTAAIHMAVAMVNEALITREQAILRITSRDLDAFLQPNFTHLDNKKAQVIGQGLPASPGAATGRIALSATSAIRMAKAGPVIIVLEESSTDDIEGMRVAQGILTSLGGMTSHASMVARGWNKVCIVGCGSIKFLTPPQAGFKLGNIDFKEGDFISIDGTLGEIFEGRLMVEVPAQQSTDFQTLMSWIEQYSEMELRAAISEPEELRQVLELGAKGIGIYRPVSIERGKIRRRIQSALLKSDSGDRFNQLELVRVLIKKEMIDVFKTLKGRPVAVCLMGPSMESYFPRFDAGLEALSVDNGLSREALNSHIHLLRESNPILGCRGFRQALVFKELFEVHVQAIFEAALAVTQSGTPACPQFMTDLIVSPDEMTHFIKLIQRQASKFKTISGTMQAYQVAALIGVPRSILLADQIAKNADLAVIDADELTRMAFALSAEDMKHYEEAYQMLYVSKDNLKQNFWGKTREQNPLTDIDLSGVGVMIKSGIKKIRSQRPEMTIGLIGSMGWDEKAIDFFLSAGVDFITTAPRNITAVRLHIPQRILSPEAGQ